MVVVGCGVWVYLKIVRNNKLNIVNKFDFIVLKGWINGI